MRTKPETGGREKKGGRGGKRGANNPFKITHNDGDGLGRYKVAYTPHELLKMEMHVTVDGRPISGSPFPLTVLDGLGNLFW
jgi:hypothetical protein